MLLGALESRIGEREDFVSLTLDADDREEVLVTWPPGKLLSWQEGDRETGASLGEVMHRLGQRLSTMEQFMVTVKERGQRMVIQGRRGKISTRILANEAGPADPGREPEPGTRQTFVDASRASPLLKVMGIMNEDGRIPPDRRRKLFQVDRLVELVDAIVDHWPPDRPLRIVDCASGKSYLSFVLNYYLTEVRRQKCRFTGLDTNRAVVESSRSTQETLGYRNMEFLVSDIASYRPPGRVDMVLSLHGCDTATDEALALGISTRASFIVAVPCCQAALTGQLDFGELAPVAAHGVFRRQMADLLTDGLRALALESHGYRVSVVEYVSPLDTPKNTMLRAVRTGRASPESIEKYQNVKRFLGVEPWIDRLLQGEKPPAACHGET